MSGKCIPPETPLLCCKSGLHSGTHVLFLILTLKHIDCVYSIKPPRTTASWRGGPNVNLIKTRYTSTHVKLISHFNKIVSNLYPHIYMFRAQKRKMSAFVSTEITIYYS